MPEYMKFRVWVVEENRMIYPGEPYKTDEYCWDYLLMTMNGEVLAYTDDDGGKGGLWEHEYRVKAIPMRYTGLKDINGKDIYEGDIIRVNIDGKWYVGEVIFSNGSFVYRTKEFQWLGGFTGKDQVEVIGNIYENPELLEE